MRVLLNRCDGVFIISHEFLKILIDRAEEDPDYEQFIYSVKETDYSSPDDWENYVNGFKKHKNFAYLKKNGILFMQSQNLDEFRHDPRILKIFDELGSERASGKYSKIEAIEIPEDVKNWEIKDVGVGFEKVIEKPREF